MKCHIKKQYILPIAQVYWYVQHKIVCYEIVLRKWSKIDTERTNVH